MQIKKEDMLLYVVTDRTWLGDNTLAKQVKETLISGATMIQMREKEISFEEFEAEAKEIIKLTKHYKVPFIINDRIDVAIAVDADGVHLGQGDEGIKATREKLGYDKIIGLSAHSVKEALAAQESGADYIGVGAVFNTNTKSDANTINIDTLKEICNSVSIPVVAIGGISKDNISKLYGTGVDGVAVISAIFAQSNIMKATEDMLELVNKLNPQTRSSR